MPKLSVILIAGAAFNGCERAVFDSSVSVAGSGVDLPTLNTLVAEDCFTFLLPHHVILESEFILTL